MVTKLREEDERRRVFTDERFPGVEIHNYGGPQFSVFELDPETGRRWRLDSFASYEHVGVDMVSDDYAQRQAHDYFDRAAKTELEPEFVEEPPIGLDVVYKDRDITDLVNNPPSTFPKPVARDFSDEQVLTPDAVISMWEKAQAMPDGPAKEAMMRRVRHAASEMESTAQRIVNVLLA